jgi:hypothetical protein
MLGPYHFYFIVFFFFFFFCMLGPKHFMPQAGSFKFEGGKWSCLSLSLPVAVMDAGCLSGWVLNAAPALT